MKKRELEKRVVERTKELEQSEEKFRASFEESNIGMCMVNLKGNFLQTNKLLSEMFGYSHDELREKTVGGIKKALKLMTKEITNYDDE